MKSTCLWHAGLKEYFSYLSTQLCGVNWSVAMTTPNNEIGDNYDDDSIKMVL